MTHVEVYQTQDGTWCQDVSEHPMKSVEDMNNAEMGFYNRGYSGEPISMNVTPEHLAAWASGVWARQDKEMRRERVEDQKQGLPVRKRR